MKAYKANAELRNGRDDWLVDWLDGFVRLHGYRLASKLLGSRYLILDKQKRSRSSPEKEEEEDDGNFSK